MADPRIEKLRDAGFSDDEIVELLGIPPDADDDEPRTTRPRSLSGWKNYARELEEKLTEQESRYAIREAQDAFSTTLSELPEDLRDFVTFDDLDDGEPITAATLRYHAQANVDAAIAEVEAEAQRYGYPNVEAYLQAHEEFAKRAQEVAEREQVNTAALQAQSELTLNAANPGTLPAALQQAEQAAAEGDVDAVFAQMRANPQAFNRRMTTRDAS